jgi:hypothetical protein
MFLRRCLLLSLGGLTCAPFACASAPTPDGSLASSSATSAPVTSADPAGMRPTPQASAAASTTPGASSNPPAVASSSATSTPPSAQPGTTTPPAQEAPPPIPPNTVVLHIGDSFLQAGFAQALKPKMKALGVRYEIRSEQSSYTTTWAGKIEQLIRETRPDLVLINLGANEIANTDPPTHAPAVRRIVKGIGERPCVWVSPPLWRKDTGILNVIRQNSAPCRFFDSDIRVTQPIPRASDKIHPTPAGGAIWASIFWEWLHGERATASPESAAPASDAQGAGATKQNPWLLKPSPPDEHLPRPYIAPPGTVPAAGSSGGGAAPAPG